jgi:hypothetical protein
MKIVFVMMIWLLLVAGAAAICLAQTNPADNGTESIPGPRLGQIREIRLLPPIATQRLSARLFTPMPAEAPTAASNDPGTPPNQGPPASTNAARGGGKSRAAATLVGLGMFAAGLYLTLTPCSDRQVTTGGVTTTTKECHQWKRFAGAGLIAGGGLVAGLGR